MAVTLSVPELLVELRLGDSTEEVQLATRRLGYASVAVVKSTPDAPDAVHNEAAVRLAAYLYDQPNAPTGDGYANALRSSGAARILLPYRVHRAGSTAEVMEEVQSVIGTVGNPVTGLSIAGETMTVTFADGTTDTLTLPSGGGAGIDQIARDSAAAAQRAADGAKTEIDTHEATHPSGLPMGSRGQRALKWDVANTSWEAVSDVETVYYGVSAEGDYTHIAAALAAGLNTAGIQVSNTTFILNKDRNQLRSDHMATLWAALSSPPPAIWALAPSHTDWIHNFTISANNTTFDGAVTEDFVYINGDKYDLLLSEHPGMEADVLANRGSVRFNYVPPAVVYTVSQTPTP